VKLRPAWKVNRRSLLASLAFALILALSVAGVWALANASMPAKVPPPAKGIHLSLRLEGRDWNVTYESNSTKNNTAFAFLLEAARTLHVPIVWSNWTLPADSILVQSIGGDTNGDGGRWWQYWIDGVYGSVGANHAALIDGDEVQWRFVQFNP